MTNFKKGLSFSVFAVLALACCLVISQAFAAELPTKAQIQQDRNAGKLDSQVPGAQTTMDQSVAPEQEASDGLKDASLIEGIKLGAPDRPRLVPETIIDNGTPRAGGETIATATVIAALPYNDFASTATAIDDYDETCPYNAPGSPDVVYSYTPAATDTLVVSLCGSAYDTKMYVYENTYTPGSPYACNDDYCDYQSEISFMEVTGGNTYYIVVDGYGGDAGDYDLNVFEWTDPLACGPGDVPEGETCGTDVNDGAYGGGVYGSIAANTTICGDFWADGGVRDNDVFHYEITNPLGEVIIWDAFADEIDYYIMIMDELCTGYFDYDIGNAGEATTVELYLGPGIYSTRITPNYAAADAYGFGCGTNPLDLVNGNYRYKLSMANRVINVFDDCEAAVQITAAGTYNWDLTGMTPGQSMVGFAGKNVWYEFVPPSVGIAHIEAFINEALMYHWGIAAGAACGGGAFALDYTGIHIDAPMVIEFPSIPGTNTIIEVAAHAPSDWVYTGWLDVTILPLPILTNDVCLDGPVDMGTGDVAGFFFHNVEATWTYLPDDWFDQGQIGCDVWFTWTADVTGDAWVSFCNSDPGFDLRMAMYEGGDCLETTPRQPIAGTDDECDRPGSGGMGQLWVPVTSGTTYLLRVGGWYQAPDYLPPSQGTGVIDITQDVGFPYAPNDDCADLTPEVLSPGTPLVFTGSQTYGTWNSCLIFDYPTVWHGFTPDTCVNINVSYCGTTEVYNWIVDDVLYDACPCYDGNKLLSGPYSYTACPGGAPGQHNIDFDDLLPKTYWLPIASGCEDYVADDYTVTITATAYECDYCGATANPGVCAFGYEYIDGIVVTNVTNLGNGCNGYQDFTTLGPIELYRSLPHLLTVELADAIASDTIGVWVDWNQNFDLTVAADHVDTYSDGNGGEGPWFATLTPPYDAKNPADPGLTGYTLMRVRCNDGGVDDPFPCGANVYGEVEDYVVEVLDWVCGDADGNGLLEQADVTFLVDMYFSGGAVPVPWQAGDANADGFVNIADIVYMAEALNGGAAPICIP